MIILEKTRRATRAAAERVRAALIELDETFQNYGVFEVDELDAAQVAYQVVRDEGGYVVTLDDPSLA